MIEKRDMPGLFTWDDSEAIKKWREQESLKIVLNVAVLTKPSQEK